MRLKSAAAYSGTRAYTIILRAKTAFFRSQNTPLARDFYKFNELGIVCEWPFENGRIHALHGGTQRNGNEGSKWSN